MLSTELDCAAATDIGPIEPDASAKVARPSGTAAQGEGAAEVRRPVCGSTTTLSVRHATTAEPSDCDARSASASCLALSCSDFSASRRLRGLRHRMSCSTYHHQLPVRSQMLATPDPSPLRLSRCASPRHWLSSRLWQCRCAITRFMPRNMASSRRE